MNQQIETQYDKIAPAFIEGNDEYNRFSRTSFYESIPIDLNGKRILDVGCGEGYDFKTYEEREANIYGIDAAEELIKIARQKFPKAKIIKGFMECLPFPDSSFDVVVSKYALQTSTNLPQVLKEMSRVLKIRGSLIYLTVHPFRQFLEKNKHPKDYYLREIVNSTFFGGKVTVREPTHTLEEYLNPEFLQNFRVTCLREHPDFPSSERIDGDTYPCFLIVKAIKEKD